MTELSAAGAETAPARAYPENLKQALGHAERGYRVFPLHENDIDPVFKRFYDHATSDPEVIKRWYTGFYRNCNVAILTGDDLIVFDFDCKKGAKGMESLALMEMVGFDPSFAVTTRSGGRHIYFQLGKNEGEIAGSQGKLEGFPGIDIRCHHNYVAAPGTIIHGQTYTIRDDLPVAPALDWMIQLAKDAASGVREKADATPLIELDTEPSIQRATLYLKEDAPTAQEGAGGNATTYAVAARVKDYGVSEEMCFELMDHHWNEQKAFPMWMPDELETVIGNAYRYGTSSPGVRDARAEFDAVEIDQPANDNRARPLTATPVRPEDFLNIPPREWMYGYSLLRKYVTFLGGSGGVGKTSWIMASAAAMASGQALLHDDVPKTLKVWYLNLEDDIFELRRRLMATIAFHDLPPETLDNIYMDSGRDRQFKIVKLGTDGSFVVTPDHKAVIEEIKRKNIDVLIVDPYLRSHGLSENENEAQDRVMELYAEIAEKANCGIILAHHTKKGAEPGQMDGLRGAGQQGNSARVVRMLVPMDDKEAAKLGISKQLKRLYVKVADGKANMSPPLEVAHWMKLESYHLGNGNAMYPKGDSVQAAARWEPPDALDGMGEVERAEALAMIERGMPDGERYSERSQDTDRWAGNVLVESFMRTPAQASAILTEWKTTKVLENRKYRSATQRKERNGLYVASEETE